MRILFIGDVIGRPGREVIATELPKVEALVALCRSGEGSYARMQDGWF